MFESLIFIESTAMILFMHDLSSVNHATCCVIKPATVRGMRSGQSNVDECLWIDIVRSFNMIFRRRRHAIQSITFGKVIRTAAKRFHMSYIESSPVILKDTTPIVSNNVDTHRDRGQRSAHRSKSRSKSRKKSSKSARSPKRRSK
jgi:hypothetical protein